MRWLYDIVMQKGYQFNARRRSFQVNASGVRFGNEHRGPVEHAPDVYAQPDQVAWTVYDQTRHESMQEFEDYRQAMTASYLVTADTLQELAEGAGLPTDRVKLLFRSAGVSVLL